MKRLSVEDFELKANRKHNWRYKYFGDYKDSHTPISIECPIHGIFQKTPNHHLSGQGCKLCNERQNTVVTNFESRANELHNFKYDYSKFVYTNNKTPSTIICPIHGEFSQSPDNHLHNHGCPKCSGNNKKTTIEFIGELKEVFGDYYDYSSVVYNGAFSKVSLICTKHGEFKKDPHHLLNGSGCKKCTSSLLENEIRLFLSKRYNGLVIEQYRTSWLGKQSLDFYLPRLKIGIECQGIQHFKSSKLFGGSDGFKKTIERDKTKKRLCDCNGVKLLYYSKLNINYPYEVITDIEELLEQIESYDSK